MHFHFFDNVPCSKNIPDPTGKGLHYHNFNGSATSGSNSTDNHTHNVNGNKSSVPIREKDISAREIDGGFEVASRIGRNTIVRNMTERKLMQEFKKLGLFSDTEIKIARQLGVNPITKFCDSINLKEEYHQ